MCKTRTSVCQYCLGSGQVEDSADDVLGNTMDFVHACDWCEGEGTIKERQIKCETCNKEEWVSREEDQCDDCHTKEVLKELGIAEEETPLTKIVELGDDWQDPEPKYHFRGSSVGEILSHDNPASDK